MAAYDVVANIPSQARNPGQKYNVLNRGRATGSNILPRAYKPLILHSCYAFKFEPARLFLLDAHNSNTKLTLAAH